MKLLEKLEQKYPNLARVLGNNGNRAIIALSVSLCANLLFVVYNGVLAVIYKSSWNIVLSGYYTLLLIAKIGLLFGFRNTKKKEKNAQFHGAITYLLVGLALFILHTPLILLVKLTTDNAFHYAGSLAYVYALYAFYKIISAIVNFVRSYKHRQGLVLQAIRNINLADAMVSILALQTALLSAMGDNSMPYANIATGGAICGVVLAVSLFMIIRASMLLEKIRRKSNGQQET